MVGFCGGYTTFSSFSLLSFDAIRHSRLLDLWLNIGFSHAFCFLGGWLGLLAGWLISLPAEGVARRLMEKQADTKIDSTMFLFPAWLVIGVPLFVAAITTLAAIYPARRASRVDPVIALKYE